MTFPGLEPQGTQQNSGQQPAGGVIKTLLTEPPLLLTVIGAVLFLVNVILLPSALAFNLLWAVLGAFIFYGAVRRAGALTALRANTDPGAPISGYSYMLLRPSFGEVIGQVFRSVFNLIFLFAIVLTVVSFIGALNTPELLNRTATLTADVALVLAYLAFVVSNGYTRAQVKAAGGKVTAFM